MRERGPEITYGGSGQAGVQVGVQGGQTDRVHVQSN